jgi:integrase
MTEKEKRWQDKLWSRFSSFLSRRSEGTARLYVYTLDEFCSFLGVTAGTDEAAVRLLEVDETTAAEYLATTSRRVGMKSRATGKKRISSATVAFKIGRLKMIYRELVRARLISINPFDAILHDFRFQSGDKRPTEAISPEKIREMLAVPDLKTRNGRREAAFLALLFGGGLRLHEALDLRLCDVTFSRISGRKTPVLTIGESKTSARPAKQPLPTWTLEPIARWLSERIAEGSSLERQFLASRNATDGRERRFAKVTAYRAFNRVAAVVGLKNKTPHSARASFATYLDSLNLPLADIALAMRHTKRESTEVYIKRENTLTRSAALAADYGLGLKKADKK